MADERSSSNFPSSPLTGKQSKPPAEICGPTSTWQIIMQNAAIKVVKISTGEGINRLDLSSIGQHQMPPPREIQVSFKGLLLLPVIYMCVHLGLQTASSAWWHCCHRQHNTTSKNERIFAGLSKSFLLACFASYIQPDKFKDFQYLEQMPIYTLQMSLCSASQSHVSSTHSCISFYTKC